MRGIKSLMVTFILCFASVNAMAQSKINNVVKEIEKVKTTKVIYTEKRNLQNKKIYKISKHITFYDKTHKEKLQKTILEERVNAVSYMELTNCVVIKFADKSGENTLEIGAFLNRQGGWSIMIKKSGYKACDGSIPEWGL